MVDRKKTVLCTKPGDKSSQKEGAAFEYERVEGRRVAERQLGRAVAARRHGRARERRHNERRGVEVVWKGRGAELDEVR